MTATSLAHLADARLDRSLVEEIAREVACVEEELARQMDSRVGIVDQVSHHTLKAGGKRLRPAFVTLSARATALPFDLSRTRRMGACMEMIHMATLLHDDVIDNSAIRRGRPTASALYGGTAAILSGDVLLAKAMTLLAADGDIEVIRTVSEATMEIAEGEAREMELRGNFDLGEEEHLEVLRLKTASFIQCCCEVGAIIAGASVEQRLAMRRYGHHVGMAFQLVDDLLDYRGDHRVTGKPIAIDYKDAQATLPLIYLRDKLSPSEAEFARHGFGNGATDEDISTLVAWMASRGAFEHAEARAKHHANLAVQELEGLSDAASRELMSAVADYVIDRQL